MLAGESNGFHLILGTSEQRERSDKQKAIGSTHTGYICAIRKCCAREKIGNFSKIGSTRSV